MANNSSNDSINDYSSPVVMLPIRGEKRIISSSANLAEINTDFIVGEYENGATSLGKQVEDSDFHISLAKSSFTDFVRLRLPHRGYNSSTHMTSVDQTLELSFLINPKSVQINKQTVDTQALTRGGWQFGVWGEDISQIHLSGVSAGAYFALGLTDEYQYYAQSYRNLIKIQQMFENNGYWFEGEEYNEGPMAADYLRRRIRMHQDLELWVGNFIWSGMFETMTINQNADNPFRLEFELSFIAWKERYRKGSGYWDSKYNNVQRGHSYDAIAGITGKTATDVALAQTTAMSNDARLTQLRSSLSSNPNANSPAVQAAAAGDLHSTGQTQNIDTFTPPFNFGGSGSNA
jgi:hypothetical protein